MFSQGCQYQIDAEDNIIFLGGSWDAFAKANGGIGLRYNAPRGKSLWTFINGQSTRFIYYTLINQVRATNKPIHFPFRSDGQNTRRYMEMEIAPGENGSIWFRTTHIKETAPDPSESKSNVDGQNEGPYRMCSWCNLILIGENWLTIEDALWFQGLMDGPEVPPLSHGICSDCSLIMQKAVQIMDQEDQGALL